MFDYVNYIKNKVESFQESIRIDSISEEDGIYTVETCNTKHLAIDSASKYKDWSILVNGIEAKVLSVVKNTSFTFSFRVGQAIPETIDEIITKPYVHFYGTALSVNEELSQKESSKQDILPLVWHLGVFNITEFDPKISLFDSEADIRLFILDDSNFVNWTSLEHYNKVILPVKTYANNFVNLLRDDTKNVYEISEVDVKEYVKFGEVSKNGNLTKLFNQDSSGIEISFKIITKKQKKNCCVIKIIDPTITITIDYSDLDYNQQDYY